MVFLATATPIIQVIGVPIFTRTASGMAITMA